jgi:hypothetical protein
MHREPGGTQDEHGCPHPTAVLPIPR